LTRKLVENEIRHKVAAFALLVLSPVVGRATTVPLVDGDCGEYLALDARISQVERA
jgi:hypothetical protein